MFAERVRALESQVPALQQHASLNNGGVSGRQGPQSDQQSLVGRVEVLEEAVDVLLQAQVRHSAGIAAVSRLTACADAHLLSKHIIYLWVGCAEDIAYDLCQRHL